MSNKALIWLNILLFLGLLLIIFELYPAPEKIYEDSVLEYLGAKRETLIEVYGEPDFEGTIGGPGGSFVFYEEIRTSFIFAGDQGVVNNLEVFSGGKVLGIKVGMTFEEIEKVLGPPRSKGYDPYGGDYTMVYYFGEEEDGLPEIEAWFSAEEEKMPTKKAEIFWKKYWR